MDAMRVIAEPRRQQILRLVWDTERSAGEIAGNFDVTFGAVSQHLGVLRRAGLVSVRKDGTRRLYLANRHALGPLAGWLESMWAGQLDHLAALAEQADDAGRTERAHGNDDRGGHR
jgi:DNA-binding transcriptional ArsR family regulator